MGKSSFVRSAGVVSACTFLSRILGFLRDMLCARSFGASMVWDAFAVAFRIPNLFRRLFGEGALTPAFAPVMLNVVLIAALLPFWRDIRTQAWAVVAGGALTLLILIPPLIARGVGVRPRLDLADPALREVARKSLPIIFGLAPVQL